jgi:predicted unusual protein kinase regulating ubiquinone biosynthesis (AarF/ABC1/UbiB family)
VAIKIQRPNCEENIAVDLYVMRWYAQQIQKILRLLNRDLDLVSIIDDFGDLIYREIDYRAEAVNAQRFAELYASIPDVFVPKVYTDLSTSKVLTMEWYPLTTVPFPVLPVLFNVFVTEKGWMVPASMTRRR